MRPSRSGEGFAAAAAQLTSTDDLEENLTTCRRLAGDAAGQSVKLLVLPENFAFLGTHERDKLAVAEILDAASPGPIAATLIELARLHQMWIVGGGLPEKVPGEDGERAYNTAVVVSPGGEMVARYRKIHLFDIAIPGKAEFKESRCTAPGAAVVVAETGLARLGLSICYDLRFPELYRELALGGAEALLVPAAFTAHTGAAHWHTLLRARAIENQSYVIAAAQVGRHNPRRETYGHSLIVDPWGEVIAEVERGVGLAVAPIDLGELDRRRVEMPCFEHRVLGRRG
jgi:predicted amidohydrolase